MSESEKESGEYELATFKLKGARLHSFVKAVGAIADECRVIVNEKGWTTKQVDPAHVAMISVGIPKKDFDEWDAPFEHIDLDQIEIGLDLDELNAYIKRCKFHEPKKGEPYSVSMLELVFMANDVSTGEGDLKKTEPKVTKIVLRTYNGETTISPVDTESMSEPKVPSLKLPSKAVFAADELGRFKAFLANAKGITDYIMLSNRAGERELMASCESDRTKANAKLQSGNGIMRESAKSLFPLDYLGNIVSALPNMEIGLEIGNDYPMVLTCPGIDATYMLAPRIESD